MDRRLRKTKTIAAAITLALALAACDSADDTDPTDPGATTVPAETTTAAS